MQLNDSVYSIVDMSTSTPEEMCRLFQCVFGGEMSPDIWRWKYRSGKLGGNINIALYRGADLVGHAGAIIFDAFFMGEKIKCAQICDVMLHPSERGNMGRDGGYAQFMSTLIHALKSALPNGLYFGFPGLRPFKLGRRLGYYRGTGVINNFRLKTKRYFAVPYFVKEISWGHCSIEKICQKRFSRPSSRIYRNQAYLKWRFESNPSVKYRILGLYLGFSLVEWAVIKESGDGIVMVDCSFTVEDVNKYLKCMSNWAFACGYSSIDFWSDGFNGENLVGEISINQTQMVGVVMCASSQQFCTAMPSWVPGDTDVM